MRPSLKLIPDFILPSLEGATYGRHLIWDDRNRGSFKVSRIHQSSAHWSDDCIAVYKAWSLMKKLWKPDDPKKVSKAKHRLITALRRNPVVEMLQTESSYYRFRLRTKLIDNNSTYEVSNILMKELEGATCGNNLTCSTAHNGKQFEEREMNIACLNKEENDFNNEVLVSFAPCEFFPDMCNLLEKSIKCSGECCCDILLDSTILSNDKCIWHGKFY